jgi:mono/diheme cytochrome c family protein
LILTACDATEPPAGDAGSAAPRNPHSASAASDITLQGGGSRLLDPQASVLPTLLTMRERGEYLVRHVAACNECHTPRRQTGEFDESRLLSGVRNLADFEPDDDTRGAVHSRNLTPDEETGLGEWSDRQIKRALQDGIDDEDSVLHWLMPYWIFHNMTDEDADAIVLYLRSIPAVVHEVPDSEPHAVEDRIPYEPYRLDLDAVPDTTLASSHPDHESARRGRYLATAIAPCMLCHTPERADDPAVPIDEQRIFTGRRKLVPERLGVVVEVEDPPRIESWNLTPHANGLGDWSALDVANTLRIGVGRDGLPVCDPMPSFMNGSFQGMREQDALDLGHYFTTLPGQDTGKVERCCVVCHEPLEADAGAP